MKVNVKTALNQAVIAISKALEADTARLDAELLLAFAMGCDRSFFFAWPEKNLSLKDRQAFEELLAMRCSGKPIAQLLRQQEFWSLPLAVNEHTLIPRPDTECLIEYLLDTTDADSMLSVIDAGTGSGAIALALAKERINWTIFASDFSWEALKIAMLNRQTLNLPVTLIHGDWLSPIANDSLDIVLSNPPYIVANDPHLAALRFEPMSALVAADNGLACIQLLAQQAQRVLKPGGQLMLEHGYNQANQVQTLLHQWGYQQIKTLEDYGGQPRHTVCVKPNVTGSSRHE